MCETMYPSETSLSAKDPAIRGTMIDGAAIDGTTIDGAGIDCSVIKVPVVQSPAAARCSGNEDDQGSDHHPGQGGALLLEEQKPQLKRPSLYRVVLMNDDYTPMEFVVDVLMSFFAMSYEKAHEVMLTVHTKGKGVCGVYTRDVAETKAMQVNQYARDNEHPLLAEVEEAPDNDDGDG